MRKTFSKLLIRRFLSSLLLLFLMVSILFVLVRLAPGDPAAKYISPSLSPQSIEKIRESFNLDEPLASQYFAFIRNIAAGDLGTSYGFRKPVIDVIKVYLPVTILLACFSFLIQITLGFITAYHSVKKIGGAGEKIADKASLILYAIPSFVLGVFLIFIFSEKLKILPSSGLHSYGIESRPLITRFLDYSAHLILPLLTLSLSGAAIFYRYLRSSIEDIYASNFVMQLRSMGLPERTITLKHILPNAAGPFISAAGIELGLLLSGALVTEVIFGLPGMGRLTVESIMSRDYPLIVGVVFVSGVMVILSNLLADLLRFKIDKRMASGI